MRRILTIAERNYAPVSDQPAVNGSRSGHVEREDDPIFYPIFCRSGDHVWQTGGNAGGEGHAPARDRFCGRRRGGNPAGLGRWV